MFSMRLEYSGSCSCCHVGLCWVEMVTQKLSGINGHQLWVPVNNDSIELLMELVMHRRYWT